MTRKPVPPPSPTRTPLPPPTATPLPPPPSPTREEREAPRPAPVALEGEIHYEGELGFAVMLPDGWIAGSSKGRLFMANSEAVWKADVPTAPLVMVQADKLAEFFGGAVAKAKTANEVLMVAAGALGDEWDVKVGSISDAQVAGYPAAVAVIEDAKPDRRPQLIGRCVAVLLEDRAAVLWSLGPRAEWQAFAPTFDGMLASATFPEPVRLAKAGAEAEPTKAAKTTKAAAAAAAKPQAPAAPVSFPAPQDLYVNATEHYSVLAPAAWRVLEEAGMFTIAASVDDFSLPMPNGPLAEVTVGSLAKLYDGAAKDAATSEALLSVVLQLQASRGITQLGGAQSVSVNGSAGVLADVSGEGLRGQLVAVHLGGDRAALMGVLAPEAQWDAFAPVFGQMVASLNFNAQ